MQYLITRLGGLELILLFAWFAALLGPIYYQYKNKTSFALSLTVSLVIAYMVQMLWSLLYRFELVEYWVWFDFVMIPARTSEIGFWHTLLSAGFLHSQVDLLHVLSNIVIIALVGIPLEQRLGKSRFILIYFIGLFGGSFAWMIFNLESTTPSLGASGAAFGILGAYLAGWPKDEIYFPIFLIRPWPVSVIALLYFGLEIARAYSQMELGQSSNVAHMAHLGGFVATYACLRMIAKGGPTALGVIDDGPRSQNHITARYRRMKDAMVDLNEIDNPWQAKGLDVPKQSKQVMNSLLESGDEAETRIAWMEKLADVSICPDCKAPLGFVERNSGPQIQCSKQPEHLLWP